MSQRAEFFFSYRLLQRGRIKRIGKGGVATRSVDDVALYLADAYPGRGWDRFDHEWHSSESAAFKAEERMIDSYARTTGSLPPWNEIRGGSGGASFVRCKDSLADGRPCRNLALAGNYGFCGVHR